MPTCFVVLGVPRSGTSCVAGILSKLGVCMGTRQIPASPMNRLGFFQDRDFEDLFWHLLDRHVIMPGEGYELPGEQQRQLRYTVENKCDRDINWGVKCSRMPFILDHFQRVCRHPIKLIMTQRDPELSIASLANWVDEDVQSARSIITQSIEKIDQIYVGTKLPVLTVDYPTLVEDPGYGVARIADFCELPVTVEAISFVQPELQNFRDGTSIRGRSEHDEAAMLADQISKRGDSLQLLQRLCLRTIREVGKNGAEVLKQLLDADCDDWLTRRQRWLRQRRAPE